MDLSDLPQPAQDRVAAAEIEADSILANTQATANQYAAEAYRMGVDPSGVGYSPGDIPLDLARQELIEGRDQAAGHLFGATAGEYLKTGKLDIEGFNAKLEAIGGWIVQKYCIDRTVLDQLKLYCRGVALRKRAAVLEAGEGSKETTIARLPTPQFPNRATWLKVRLQERSWNKHDLSRQGGPDCKTVQKILDGQQIREEGLEKVATALSNAPTKMKLPKVTLLDIPQD